MLASPKPSEARKLESFDYVLDNYIFPGVELLHDLLKASKLPADLLKSHFISLLDLVTSANINEVSKNLAYDAEDEDLKKSIKTILGSDNKPLLKDVYEPLYCLLHQYILNKSPDKQSDIDNNALVAQRIELEGLSREALYEETVPLLGTLLSRMEKFDPEVTTDILRRRVVDAIKTAKDKILAAPQEEEEVVDHLKSAPTFVPAFKDPRFLRQRQIVEDEEYAERMAREFQEEEDRATALALQATFSDNEEEAEPDGEPDDEPEDEVDNDEQGEVDNDEQDEEDASANHSQSKVRRLNHR